MQNGTIFKVLPNGNLNITLTEEGREWLREEMEQQDEGELDFFVNDEMVFLELCETPLCNGYNQVSPETVGALTDSLILSDGILDEETTEEQAKATKVWWFPNYAICSYLADLIQPEGITFTLAEDVE
jgi:hypothetical protein